MAAELPDPELLDSPDWTISVAAEETGHYEELMREAAVTYRQGDARPWFITGGPSYEPLDYIDEYDERSWDRVGDELYSGSKLFRTVSVQDKVAMLRTWHADASWIYETELSNDGFWTTETPKRRILFDRMSRYVVSGLLGGQLLEENKDLEDLLEPFGGSRLDKAILLGGAAVARETGPVQTFGAGAVFLSGNGDVTRYETWTGGDMAGDFRMNRTERPVHPATTTIRQERTHVFMPVPGEVQRAGAYHGTESDIIGALLAHLVVKRGVPRMALHDTLIADLSSQKIMAGGNFGDYGQGDGHREASLLRSVLEKPELIEGRDELFSGIVVPWQSHRFEMVSQSEGVRLRNLTEGTNEEYSGVTLADEEIPAFVVNLIRGGGGRTGPHSMLAVINALKPEDAV